MGQAAFLRALFEHGRVRVGPPRATAKTATTRDDAADADAADVDAALLEWDAANREEFPGDAPPLALDVARWAAGQFHLACQCAVYRDIDAATIAAALNLPCPTAPAASQHYSADLVFRFLPDLLRLAKSAAEGDPLCDRLRQWAGEWPLSSVGMTGVNPGDVSAVLAHSGLLRLYIDRLIARRDVSRLADPRVRAAVRTALGAFDDLAPPIAAALKNYDDAGPTPVATT